MESIRSAGEPGVDTDVAFDAELDAEFEALVAQWNAQLDTEAAERTEVDDQLDALRETRAVMAAMQAREQQCLARLGELALDEAGPRASGDTRDMAWRSMAAEIAVTTRLADRTVQSMMNSAYRLVNLLPQTLDALRTGRISQGHVRVIMEHSIGLEDAALPQYEQATLGRAETATPGQLSSTARIAAIRLRESTLEDRHSDARQQRGVSIRDLDDGMSELVHHLPTVYAAAIFDRLTRQATALEHDGEPRTRDQLRSDLATDLLLTGEPADGADAPHTAAAGIRAEVSITIPLLTLLGDSDHPATLLGRGPIDLDTACRLAAHAPELTRVITHPVTGLVITADTYRPTASLRRYLEQRDRHCQFPVCNRDARRCDIDHTTAYADGGPTTPDNLAVLCRGHHTLKHHSRWKVKQVTPGVLEWTSPQGNTVTPTLAPAGPRFTPAA